LKVKYYIQHRSQKLDAAVRYVWEHLGRDYNIEFQKVEQIEECHVSLGFDSHCTFTLSNFFLQNMESGVFSWKEMLNLEDQRPIVLNEFRAPDFLLSSFYLLSGMQEWSSFSADRFGRFPYVESCQKYFGGCETAWVDEYFEEIFNIISDKISIPKRKEEPTEVVLTHDIDHLQWPIVQNIYSLARDSYQSKGIQPLKKIRFLLRNTRRNLEEIIQLEKRFNTTSIFFWLVEQGPGQYGVKNADYSSEDRYVQKVMDVVDDVGGTNALHKSSKAQSITQELQKCNRLSEINRFHYLMFSLKNQGEELEFSVDQDYSYGFAEHYGFRNSYSKPFHPFDFDNWEPFCFLEVPLTIMDTTFTTYLKLSPDEALERLKEFLGEHQNNSFVSILWHNDYFNPFKFSGWKEVYEALLVELFEKGSAKVLTPREVEEKYRIYEKIYH